MVFNLHEEMTLDTLEGLGFLRTAIETREIAEHAWETDISVMPDEDACHRVKKYQNEFEAYGGKRCSKLGAETFAADFARDARKAFEHGNRGEGREQLGSAIHFIQDALCPAHVFPFRCDSVPDCHKAFEDWALRVYGSKNWSSLVRSAPTELISDSIDLLSKLREAADWVATLPCSYVRQDKLIVVDSRIGGVSSEGWKMRDDDIGSCMRKAASLVKETVVWTRVRRLMV